jgi:hypothetical protein
LRTALLAGQSVVWGAWREASAVLLKMLEEREFAISNDKCF